MIVTAGGGDEQNGNDQQPTAAIQESDFSEETEVQTRSLQSLATDGIKLSASKAEEEWFYVGEDPSSGYSWLLDHNCGGIAKVESSFASNPDQDKPGRRWFHVVGMNAGQCELKIADA